MPRLTLHARYVFPVAGPPIPEGSVVLDGERIVAVGRRRGGEVHDFGNAAILPGLVNAHVHLDFSDRTAPLGEPGIGLADWIRLAIDHRRSTNDSQDGDSNSRGLTAPGARAQRVAFGLGESVRCGVTAIGEIAQPDWPVDTMVASPIGGVVFQELIAPTAVRVPAALELAQSHVRKSSRGLTAPGAPTSDDRGLLAPGYWQKPSHWRPGLSPHAPYTVHPELLSAAIAISAAEQVPVAMHLAESPEELELLLSGTGPLRELLEEMDAWDAAFRLGMRPLDYLRRLASAHRALVVHGNYLDDEEIAFLAAHAARMAAVYCPRSHQWFAHRPYPLQKMLAAGVAVALGTDGRGSSPDLSLLAEMRLAARRHPDVGRDRILQMGTIFGARALGLEDQIGSLSPGKRADLTIVALPDGDAADPHELLFESDASVTACYCRGESHSPRGCGG